MRMCCGEDNTNYLGLQIHLVELRLLCYFWKTVKGMCDVGHRALQMQNDISEKNQSCEPENLRIRRSYQRSSKDSATNGACS